MGLYNSYPNGKGHRIMIRYIGANTYRSVTIAGTIIDKTTGEPLSARIYAMEDSTGRLLMEPTADPEAGTDSYAADSSARRSEERRVGKEGVSTCRSRW